MDLATFFKKSAKLNIRAETRQFNWSTLSSTGSFQKIVLSTKVTNWIHVKKGWSNYGPPRRRPPSAWETDHPRRSRKSRNSRDFRWYFWQIRGFRARNSLDFILGLPIWSLRFMLDPPTLPPSGADFLSFSRRFLELLHFPYFWDFGNFLEFRVRVDRYVGKKFGILTQLYSSLASCFPYPNPIFRKIFGFISNF